MASFGPKRPRIRLEPEEYRRLRQKVLARDGWRCQRCGGLRDVQVHHMQRRSALGDDSEQNLITLCMSCHLLVHLARESPIDDACEDKRRRLTSAFRSGNYSLSQELANAATTRAPGIANVALTPASVAKHDAPALLGRGWVVNLAVVAG